jgi:hypothetical protein
VVVIEDFIDNLVISSSERQLLKDQYAEDMLINGNQTDVHDELEK